MTVKRRDGVRYVTPDGPEGEFQPGSRNRILRNLLGITKKTDMDRAEYESLLKAQELFLERVGPETCFTADLIKEMHRCWLGGIYLWAGEYRTVELQKGSFRWPPAFRVDQNMLNFEADVLRRNTPCRSGELHEVSRRIAEVHAELLLIHPFRDGNGRVARWLADLMALQAGLPSPRYDFDDKRTGGRNKEYLEDVVRGYGQDYEPLASFFAAAIEARLAEVR
jgi:cell filamentation protein